MIRPFNSQDTDYLIDVWRAASALAHPFLSPDFIEQEANNMREMYLPNAKTFVFESDGSPIGFIAMIDTEIGGLFLHPNHHGKGIGRALVDHVVADLGPLKVEVFDQNAIGRRFYDRYGFVETGRYKHEPTSQMTLKLAMKKH